MLPPPVSADQERSKYGEGCGTVSPCSASPVNRLRRSYQSERGVHSRLCVAQCATWHSRLQAGQGGAQAEGGTLFSQ